MSCESTGRPAILHIVNSTGALSPESATIEQWCEQANLCVERCPHVYLGLARLLKHPGKPFCGVLICVEDLSPDEFEFFTLMDRARRDVPVQVYGSRAAERVVQALQSGARGLATRDGVLALGARPVNRADIPGDSLVTPAGFAPAVVEPVRRIEEVKTQPVEAQPAPTPAPAPVVAPTDEAKTESKNEPAVSLEEADEGADEGSSDTARVPWLRYNGGPERTSPRKPIEVHPTPTQPAAEENDPVELYSSPCSLEDHYEPLLTEQELAALLGDEMSEISREERDMLAGDGETPGGGAR